MELVENVVATIRKYRMLDKGDRVLVGLSGGPDSVCLLSALHAVRSTWNLTLFAVYIDHGLRPAEVPGEIAFCKELCERLEIFFSTRPIDVAGHAHLHKMNIHEAARELRYAAFESVAKELNASKIALGHNADDQAETVLMRLLRGSGPSGLSGIPPVRARIIRPLIESERREIQDYLDSQRTTFLIDSSNLKDVYLRNKVRHLIFPFAKNVNHDVVRTIARTADILREEEHYFDVITTKQLMKLICRKSDAAVELFLVPLLSLETVILRRVLRHAIKETRGLQGISFVHIEDILSLVRNGRSGDRMYLPRGIRVIKGYSTLLITSERPKKLGTHYLSEVGALALPEISLQLTASFVPAEEAEALRTNKGEIAFIDADKIEFPLTVRPRQPGDFFLPAGFGKRKKLQDYFVDEKVPRDMRDSVPLVIDRGQIVWVGGYRLDERYKVDKSTKRIIKVEVAHLA